MSGKQFNLVGIGASGPDLDTLWAAFCAPGEAERRIDALRANEAPCLCPTCGSTTPEIIDQKWCGGCSRFLPVTWFARARGRKSGRASRCSGCHKAYAKSRRIILVIRPALERVAPGNRITAGKLGLDPLEVQRQIDDGNKWCWWHKAFEPRTGFGVRRSNPDSLNNICLEAMRLRSREAMRRSRERRAAS